MSEGGAGEGAPGSRAETPQQMVKQIVPLQPVGAMVEQIPTLQPVEDPILQHVDMP